VAATGLCLSDFGVLEALLHRGPLSVSELRKRILISSGSTTASIDRLEREGLVRREMESTDRRSRTVHLTELGRSLIEKQFEAHERDMELAFSKLTGAEMSALLPILRKISRTTGELTDERKKAGAVRQTGD